MMIVVFKHTLSVEIGETRDVEPTVALVPNLVVQENQRQSFSLALRGFDSVSLGGLENLYSQSSFKAF